MSNHAILREPGAITTLALIQWAIERAYQRVGSRTPTLADLECELGELIYEARKEQSR